MQIFYLVIITYAICSGCYIHNNYLKIARHTQERQQCQPRYSFRGSMIAKTN